MIGAFLLGIIWTNELSPLGLSPSIGVTIFLTLLWIAWRTNKNK